MFKTSKNKRIGMKYIALLVSVVCLFILPISAAADLIEESKKLGQQAADHIAKEYKFVDDPDVVNRVETIGHAIAEIAKTTRVPAGYGSSELAPFDYQFKVIVDDEVNAFAIPGGFVYVNTGLIDSVQSDDELAAVIAHEIAHVAHHHGMHLLKEQEKELTKMAIAMIIGAAVKVPTTDMGVLAQALSLWRIAKISDYGIDAEFDADRTAVRYLANTEYNPVGMLTFLERHARDSIRKPNIDFGIFSTHPPFPKRARQINQELDRLGVEVNRRLVTSYMQVDVKSVEDSNAHAVWLGDTKIVKIASADGESSILRAERFAERLTGVLMAGAKLHDVKVEGGNKFVYIMGQLVFSPKPEDIELAGSTEAELVTAVAAEIRKALFKEFLEQRY